MSNERPFFGEEHESSSVDSIQLSDINQGSGLLRVGMKVRVQITWQMAYMGSVQGKIKEIIPTGEARYSGNGTKAYIIVIETKKLLGKKERRINTDSRKDNIKIDIIG